MQVVYQSSGVVDLWRPNSGLKKYVAAGLTSGVLDLTRLDWLFDTAKIIALLPNMQLCWYKLPILTLSGAFPSLKC